MAAFQPSDTLKSRTYFGLILSQFLAAFNDQASHIVAIFYASDMLVRYAAVPRVHEKDIITVVTACFISPFFFFSPLAGMLADKYSKRTILVGWKLAEVAMMALGLVGFLLPHCAPWGWAEPRTLAVWSAVLVVSVVFLMGTHSAFFVPAKYGVMPEILQPTVLSRGNGILEGTSFLAQILGTAVGGILYSTLKSGIHGHVLHPGREWLIGVVLLGLAVLGAVGSLLIARMPAAAPEQPLTWKLWQPLKANVGVLLRSRPLALSVVGIAFFTFMTLFLRQTLLYEGEIAKHVHDARAGPSGKVDAGTGRPPTDFQSVGFFGPLRRLAVLLRRGPQQTEFKIALLIALVGLGVGLGSPLAGYLSGNKVELGLVPIGACCLAAITAAFAGLNAAIPVNEPFWRSLAMVVCLVLIGIAASLYIVPLYTLLQHRAPKDSKGNLVATSNFVNVAGGLIAVAVFYLLTNLLETVFDFGPTRDVHQLERKLQLAPAALFLAASLLTIGMLVLLCRLLPDFFVRSLLWLRSRSHYRLKVIGLNNLPSNGPCLLATNCDRFESCMQVVSATDRFTGFILLESREDERPRPLLRYLARRTGLVALHPEAITRADRERALARAARTLDAGNLLGLTVDGDWPPEQVDGFLNDLEHRRPTTILPVYCGVAARPAEVHAVLRRVRVVIGRPLPPESGAADIRQAIRSLGDWLERTERAGVKPTTVLIPEAAAASPTAPAAGRPGRP